METFVPLYISNHCDSLCKMCNFNRNNTSLERIQATESKVVEQLMIIRDYEHISAVCILTGEVYGIERRMQNLQNVCCAINHSIDLGFERIFFNIGSLSNDEIIYIKDNVRDPSKLVLSLFQETYDPISYQENFGAHPESNSKADFQNRLETISRWLENGFKSVDIGILLGFKQVENDVDDLINHARHYIQSGAEVYISTPRIKNGLIHDSQYIKIIKRIHREVPTAKLIITTRESIEFINKVLDYISVISPGSSDICPYDYTDYIPNCSKTSQFVIDEKRLRPMNVLKMIDYQEAIMYFNV